MFVIVTRCVCLLLFSHVVPQAVRIGQMDFLIAYAFGNELWAPWSEELGRWPILQLSLFLVNSTSSPHFCVHFIH